MYSFVDSYLEKEWAYEDGVRIPCHPVACLVSLALIADSKDSYGIYVSTSKTEHALLCNCRSAMVDSNRDIACKCEVHRMHPLDVPCSRIEDTSALHSTNPQPIRSRAEPLGQAYISTPLRGS